MSSMRYIIDWLVNWVTANVRFSYLLPDTLEAMLYLGIALYFTSQFAQA
ncbi:MAG: hypothetical protein ABSF09_04630 [Candidatus Bathyarchaeia archaeon]|jgi:hypothetical protein